MDATVGHAVISLLNVIFGHHHIFYGPRECKRDGLYKDEGFFFYYKVMSFSLKIQMQLIKDLV